MRLVRGCAGDKMALVTMRGDRSHDYIVHANCIDALGIGDEVDIAHRPCAELAFAVRVKSVAECWQFLSAVTSIWPKIEGTIVAIKPTTPPEEQLVVSFAHRHLPPTIVVPSVVILIKITDDRMKVDEVGLQKRKEIFYEGLKERKVSLANLFPFYLAMIPKVAPERGDFCVDFVDAFRAKGEPANGGEPMASVTRFVAQEKERNGHGWKYLRPAAV